VSRALAWAFVAFFVGRVVEAIREREHIERVLARVRGDVS
jgi:hypothetical protein